MACREFEMGRVSCNWPCIRGNVVSHCLKENICINHILLASERWSNASSMTFSSTFFLFLSWAPTLSQLLKLSQCCSHVEHMHLKGAVETECCISSLFQKKCERYWPESKEDVFVCEPFTIHYVRDTSSFTHTTLPVLVFYMHSDTCLFKLASATE